MVAVAVRFDNVIDVGKFDLERGDPHVLHDPGERLARASAEFLDLEVLTKHRHLTNDFPKFPSCCKLLHV